MIIDTGSSFLVVPQPDFQLIAQQVGASTGILFNKQGFGYCSSQQVSLVPDLTLLIDGVKYTLPANALVSANQGICRLNIT